MALNYVLVDYWQPNYAVDEFTADAGGFVASGQAATLSTGLSNSSTLSAEAGAYVFTGQAASFVATRVLSAGAGSVTLAGDTVGLTLIKASFNNAFGNFPLDGGALNGSSDRWINGKSDAYAATGQAAALGKGYKFSALAGALTLSGQSAQVLHHRKFAAGASAFELAGGAADFVRVVGISFEVQGGELAASFGDVDFYKGRMLVLDAGQYGLNGGQAQVVRRYRIAANAASIGLFGNAIAYEQGVFIPVLERRFIVKFDNRTFAMGESADRHFALTPEVRRFAVPARASQRVYEGTA